MKRSIVVVGSANVDLVCHAARIPKAGETLRGSDFRTTHGGKGANQAVAAGRLGGDVAMVAKVGDDDFGEMLREGLRAASVGVEEVSTEAGVTSGVALISVDAAGQNSILVIAGANGRLLPADLERCRPRLEGAGLILTQLETPMETVAHLCRMAAAAGVPVMLDPAPVCELDDEMLRGVTYLTPNESETAQMCGMGTEELTDAIAERAAGELLDRGAKNVILKLGERGVYVATADGLRVRVPAFAVKVADTTAAGDAFNGGLATALMRGERMVPAVRFAMAVAAISVTRAGAQTSMPTGDEVAAFLRTQHVADDEEVSR